MPESQKVTLAVLKEQVHNLKESLNDHKQELDQIEKTVDELSDYINDLDKMIAWYKGIAVALTTLVAVFTFLVKEWDKIKSFIGFIL